MKLLKQLSVTLSFFIVIKVHGQSASNTNTFPTTNPYGSAAIASTASTSYRLSINGNIKLYGIGNGTVTSPATGNVASPTLFIHNTTASTGRQFGINATDAGALQIFDVTASNALRFIINNSGNVGIGTASPTFTLDVTGTGRFTSSITGNSFIKSGGTSSQFLKADGSVDANAYYLTSNPSGYISKTGISALAPILYNNTTGVFSADTSTGSSHLATQYYVDSKITTNNIPTLQNVTDAGNITNKDLNAERFTVGSSGSFYAKLEKIWNPSVTTLGGTLTLKSNEAAVFASLAFAGLSSRYILLPDESDTLATRSFARSLTAGGGSQWTTTGNNIYYNTGNVGIGTALPEKKLDVNGILQVRRLGDADVNNPTKNSNAINFQTGYWDGTASQTGNWSMYSRREIGFYFGDPNKNKSKFVITANYANIDRFVLDENGDFTINNRDAASILNYDHWTGRLNIPGWLWTGPINAAILYTTKVAGSNWPTTKIDIDRTGLLYTANGESGVAITSHAFTSLNPLVLTNSNIATFDNGGTPLVTIDKSGNVIASAKVVIGTTNISQMGTHSLAVNGSAIFTKAVVKLNSSWPDYVFTKDYKLPTLYEIENYIKLNKHLPDVPSAADVEKNGIDLGDNQAILLKKIEELTLIIIEQEKRVKALEEQLKK